MITARFHLGPLDGQLRELPWAFVEYNAFTYEEPEHAHTYDRGAETRRAGWHSLYEYEYRHN